MRFRLAFCATLIAVTGCGTPSSAPGDPLAGTCQFKPCVCADASAPFWQEPETVPIIWSRTSGTPACPLGFVLQRTKPE